MELRHLRYFLAVAEQLHFRKAAEELLVSQPTLSQQIKDLERELGVPLFERVGRRVRLTDAGRTFRNYAIRSLKLLEEAQTVLDQHSSLVRGRLRVGVVQTVNAYLTPQVIANFLSTYPLVSLHVDELSAPEIEQLVFSGQLDLGISFQPEREDRFEIQPLFSEELVLVVPDQHTLASRKRIRLSKLEGLPLALLGQQFCTRRLVESCLSKAGVKPEIAVEMNSVEGLLALVSAGGPPTILPALAANEKKHHIVRLEGPKPMREVCQILVRGHAPVAARMRFSEELRQQARGSGFS